MARVLVGFDGSEGGHDALELTRLLTSRRAGSVLLATVLFGGPLPIDLAGLEEGEAGEAEPMFEQARAKLAGVELETRAYGGASAAAILNALAEEKDFDAIVVGSPHRGAIGRVVLGSTARNLLDGAPTDVAVAPCGYAAIEHETIESIAVAYDGSPEAKLALRRAEGLAKSFGARIKLLTVVVPPVATPTMVPGAYAPQSPAEPEKVIDEGVDSVDPGLAVEPARLDGDPAIQILKACERGVDLLVLGSRGYGPLARVLLGSVSREVIQKARCPVLSVRRP
jgi:nucleotide-binding universal stress UspA family protein